MMPIYKLEKLPRKQKLRKISLIFTEAETRICRKASDSDTHSAVIDADELRYFSEITQNLAQDQLFSQAARDLFTGIAKIFTQAAETGQAAAAIQRALNGARHLLLDEIGRTQADWDFVDSGGRLDPAHRRVFPGMQVYLEDIRSPFNVGAMFRSAESFGAEKMYLSPFCADPNHVRARRTAMGCIDVLPWERRELFAGYVEQANQINHIDDADDAENCKQPENIPGTIFALETGGIPLAEFSFPARGILIAGSEELGVSPGALAIADASLGRVSIPCYGAKGSLNVSVAFGIVMQAWAEQLLCF